MQQTIILPDELGSVGEMISNEMISNSFNQFEDRQEDMIPTATHQIYQYISEYLNRDNDTNVNRASAATMCVRRRWYQRNNYKQTPLTPRKMVNFLLGDLSERVVLFFIKQALVGEDKLYSEVDFGEVIGEITFQGKPLELYKQKTMSFTDGDIKITGHADGFGKRNSDGQWELIEIKSAADYGFDKFVDDGPGDYIKQSHALMMTDECKARDIKSVRYYYLRKNTGNLYDKLYPYSGATAALTLQEYRIANEDVIPSAPYMLIDETHYKKSTGRLTCSWRCAYCPFTEQCHGKFKKEFKNGKPKLIWEKKV